MEPFSGLGYIVGSTFADLAGDWRWGVRVTPFLNLIALVLMTFFLADPPRGLNDSNQLRGCIFLVNDLKKIMLWPKKNLTRNYWEA